MPCDGKTLQIKLPAQETMPNETCDSSLQEHEKNNKLVQIKFNSDALINIFQSQLQESQENNLRIELEFLSSKLPVSSSTTLKQTVKFGKERPNGSVQFIEAEVSVNRSISQLKHDMVALYNIPAEHQSWLLKNKLMDDEKFLRDYQISEKDVILMKDGRPALHV
ncbi:uncharacterized protein LOC131950112 [Physella acuta]|uniref:uncharacterized protein LOC131950112 n=1 Tax=Physella acuta TaxID=109671 RepID=UPI0027DDE256|nr:uncharacterized protein LOC131950112 [Physella acuta]